MVASYPRFIYLRILDFLASSGRFAIGFLVTTGNGLGGVEK